MKKALTQEEFDALYHTTSDFSGYDLRLCNLSGRYFTGTTFNGANLNGVDMSSSQFYRCDFTDCDMVGVNIAGSIVQRCKFNGSRMYEIKTEQADFWKCDFTSVNIEHSQLNNTIICSCDFYDAHIVFADFTGSNLSGSNFGGAYLENVTLDNLEDIGCIGDGAYIKILRVGDWGVAYTHDTLKIGNEQRLIDVWKENPHTEDEYGADDDFIKNVLIVVSMFPVCNPASIQNVSEE